jgi:transposase-like protein
MKRPLNQEKYCVSPECAVHRQQRQGYIVVAATYSTQSGRRRIYRCKICRILFSETNGTAFFDLRTPVRKILLGVRLVAQGMSFRAVAQALGTERTTLMFWLSRVIAHTQHYPASYSPELKQFEVCVARQLKSIIDSRNVSARTRLKAIQIAIDELDRT